MKKIILLTSMVLASSFAVAAKKVKTPAAPVKAEVSACASKSATKLDFIGMIANSEAIGQHAGLHRDVSTIEVFAVSSDLTARANITYTDINGSGDSNPVTYNVRLNCDAGGVIELED
jgi:hypothetical protein